jgi:uncharacterized protein YndB with AHSA1/START domain
MTDQAQRAISAETGGKAAAGAFVTSRRLAAPRELVWKAFTEPERLKRWWGPKGFSCPDAKVDLRPGGLFHYRLVSPDGQELWGRFVYREIAAPVRLDYVMSFSDAAGGVTRHPWAPDWPLESLSTITLSEADGGTEVTVAWAAHNAAEAERRTFDESHESMRHGWAGTFEQLAAYLAEAGSEAPSMHAGPQAEHEWLQRLVGEWRFAADAGGEPGHANAEGRESVRPLGDLWVLLEGEAQMPGGGPMRSLMTLGYDPAKGHFVGTFVASMMTHLWVYEGVLDEAGRVLTLDCEGPNFATGGMSRYQDIITLDGDSRTLAARMLGEDGEWREIMRAEYRRTS